MSLASESPLRVFFSMTLSAEMRAAAGRSLEALRATPDGEAIRWVNPDHLHVTLKFIAALHPDAVPPLVEAVGEKLAGRAPFTCRLGALQPFPSERRPRVLAWDLKPPEPVLALAEAVEQGAASCGLSPEERPFRAHLTAARLRNRRYPDLERVPAVTPGEWPVREVCLIQSDLQPTGPVYTLLHRLPLAKET